MSIRPSFAWVSVAVWLRVFAPALINYVEAPHAPAVIGLAAARTGNSVLAAWVTTGILVVVCTLALAWPQPDRTRAPLHVALICIAVPTLAFTQASALGLQTQTSVIEFGLLLLIFGAAWTTAPSYFEVAIIGYLGGLSALASVVLAMVVPANAVFVDQYGYTTSTKALIGDTQIAGIFGHSNTLGMVAAVSLALLFRHHRSLFRDLMVVACLAAVVLSASRTAQLTVATLALYWLMAKLVRHNGKEVAALMLVPPALAVLVPLLVNSASAFTSRGAIWGGALRATGESWFIGLGSNWFNQVLLNTRALGTEAVSGHNILVHVVATSGIVGVVIYSGFLGTLGTSVRFSASNGDRQLVLRVFVAIFTIGILEFAWSFEPGGDLFLTSWFLVASMNVVRSEPKHDMPEARLPVVGHDVLTSRQRLRVGEG